MWYSLKPDFDKDVASMACILSCKVFEVAQVANIFWHNLVIYTRLKVYIILEIF